MDLTLHQIPSPIGTVLVVSDADALRALDFDDYAPRMHELLRRHYARYTLAPATVPTPATRAVQAYFDGDLAAFDTVATQTAGTPFQRAVWAELRRIPAGSTTSYGRLAAQLGRPSASRAVGMANGANPVSIAVPCHRVIGANAALTGYGGGLPRKQWLLDHERRHA